MNTLERIPSASFAIEGLPRIDRYFPDCWSAVVEAASKFLFGIQDFGKIYGRHTFHYQKPPGPIAYRSNGVELDLMIHREPVSEAELAARIDDVYGIRTSELRFQDLASYTTYCCDSIRNRVPVITDFDFASIKARREYGKVHGSHVLALHAYDPVDGSVLAAEQMLGTIAIEARDFRESFEYKLGHDGGVRVWKLTRVRGVERNLELDEVREQVRSNLENLEGDARERGLLALELFARELAEYLASDRFEERPFSIPGLWVFSHERHIERKWLKAIRHLAPEHAADLFQEFDQILESSFTRWLNTDYLLEKCLLSDNGKGLKAIPSYLDAAVREEARARDAWRRLDVLLESAGAFARN